MKMHHYQRVLVIAVIVILLPLTARADADRLIIEGFSNGVDEKGAPVGWELKENEGTPQISLVTENGDHVLHLASDNASFGITKEIEVDLKQYPFINFRWKATELPKGGDFREKKTDDQAGQLYVVFGTFKLTAKIVGYLWENKTPKFTTGVSPAWGKTRLIVLQSGPENIGKWMQEKRNVYDDYKTLFGKEPPKTSLISIFINSQHTKSRAECYYGEISFSKR
ncbi:MAG: hypothetical protein DRG87_03145 [Deltaproteobacteria bacterium]|nr:MAG: hypothetical protein DRG87_03145 [Deltaproteobacteria bacterium]